VRAATCSVESDPRIDAVGKLRLVFVALDPEKERAEQEREQHPGLGEADFIHPGGLEGEHDRDAGADEHERVEGADRLAQVHVVRLRPDGGTEPEHDVAAEQRGEEHDLRGEEEPHDQLALREGQARLILQRHVAMVAVAVVVAMVVAVRNGDGGGVHRRCLLG